MTYLAKEYVHNDPMKLLTILDKVVAHRPWFNDFQWEDEDLRRQVAREYLADALAFGKLWEVWKITETVDLVGIMLLNRVNYKIDASCHFVFFDRDLQTKRRLCLEMMQWAFEHFDLQALRIEVPTYAHALIAWARRKLGFRYEAEARPISWPEGSRQLSKKVAELGSRKHKATRYKGEWLDALLLSITREEFERHDRAEYDTQRCEHSATAGADGPLPTVPAELHAEPAADAGTVPTD
jgi:RimJ/RimL family protein N-acetyltransferase